MGINYISGEQRPWFIRAPVDIADWLKKNETDPIPKIDPNWKPPEDFKIRALTEEEASKVLPGKLQEELKAINAEDLAKDLSEEQQWTLVETMESMEKSMLAMQHSIWSDNNKVCGAVYGSNLAKIDFACRILGSEYKEKLKDALDWFAERTVLETKNMFQIRPGYPDYQKFAQVFQQVGNSAQDAINFKRTLQESLSQLRLSLGNKHITNLATHEELVYEPLIVDDWDNYIKKLISHNAGPDNLSEYILKYDVTV